MNRSCSGYQTCPISIRTLPCAAPLLATIPFFRRLPVLRKVGTLYRMSENVVGTRGVSLDGQS